MSKKTQKSKTQIEEEGVPLCPECGSQMIEEKGELLCPNCDSAIDFFGDEKK